MDTAGLNAHRSGIEHLPVLGRVRSTRGVDRVGVRMLPGQTAADWGKIADRLAQTFGALDCRIRTIPGKVHELELWFLTTDPLAQPVQPLKAVSPVCWDGLPVGLREDGQAYRLRIRGTHVLVVGATGAGKGSVLWSIITQLVPGVCDGTVRLGRSTRRAAWNSRPAPPCSTGSSTATTTPRPAGSKNSSPRSSRTP